MMGTSSLAAIPIVLHVSGHLSWSQRFRSWVSAPQPKEPDASEYTLHVGAGEGKKDRPFQCCSRHCHHAMSARASTLRRMKCEGLDTRDIRENSEWRKIRLGLITVAACDRWPMRDSRSLRVHALRVTQCRSRVCSRERFFSWKT